MARFLLDPTGERTVLEREQLPRPASVQGLTIGLLDISKPRGDVFLDRIEERLGELGATVKRYKKPTFTKPAPEELLRTIAMEADFAIEALAD